MCRLGGLVLTQRPRTVKFYEQTTEDLLMLLVNMEEALGGDGNSLSFHYPNGDVRIIKEHRKVNRLFHRFNEIKRNLMDGAIIVQLHARLSTCGPSKHHENMHPFTHGDIIGCHNGSIQDNFLWTMLEEMGHEGAYSTTDSEAIFASLNTFAPSLRPTGVQEVIDLLEGTYAITAVTKQTPNMLFLLAGENPLAYWHDRKTGQLWYASTGDLLPESLPVTERKVTRTYKTGKNKGKKYTTTVRDIHNLDYGEGLYIRAGKKEITIESHMFDVWSTYYGYNKNRYYDESWDDWDTDWETGGGLRL